MEDDEDARRIGFVDSLLNTHCSLPTTPSEAKRMSSSEMFTEGNILQMVTDSPSAVPDENLSVNTGTGIQERVIALCLAY